MGKLTVNTGNNVVVADKNEEYGVEWAKAQLDNIASFSKEFIAAARGKVFLTVLETHSAAEFEEISKDLGFESSQAYRYVDYAKKEGVIAHVKSLGFQNKLPMNVVNELPSDNDQASAVLAEANTIAKGKTVTAEIVVEAKKNIGLGVAGTKNLDLSRIQDRSKVIREYLLAEKGYSLQDLQDYSSLDNSPLRLFRTQFEEAIDANYPQFDVFYKACKPNLTGESLQLLENLNDAVELFYAFKTNELKYNDLEADKAEASDLFNSGKI